MATEYTPYEMGLINNWVAWELRANPDNLDKPKKVPINPHTGYEAKSDNPATWGNINQALERQKMLSNGGGVGFMFGVKGNASGIAGIDLDNCFDSQGNLKDYAREIVEIMNSYTEISPSKNGLHILFTLLRSLHEMRADIETGKKNVGLGIEIYDSGRYFTVTGAKYGEAKDILERTEQAQKVLSKYFAVSKEPKAEASPSPVRALASESDSELWQKMFNSKNGFAIRRLYDGDISDYDNDDSRADSALCFYLAYWTNDDAVRIEQMMNQSVLGQREKWRNRPDYRQMTIEKAISKTREYIPNASTVASSSQPQQQQQAKSDSEVDLQPQPLPIIFDSQYLRKSLKQDIFNFQQYSDRKTGFSNLDAKLTLYPGLYVVGAISSLGKTTFCLQLADQLAESGEHVLYFAFEQTRFELVSKSLARMCQPESSIMESYPTAMQIRKGNVSEELIKTAGEYDTKIGKRKAMIECNFETDTALLKQTVNAFIKQYEVKPVVFVDYLQLIRSDNRRLTNTKDIVDENIRALKLLQMQHGLVMFVVSSLNRQNYLTPIDFEAFKESGAIEYTADVIIGLQLAVMSTNSIFSKANNDKQKREAVKEAKRKTPREIELCILKNRYGVSNESFYFNYYPKFDLFAPTVAPVEIDYEENSMPR